MGIPDNAKDEIRGGYTQHNIKIESKYFRHVVAGTKTFEIRLNDRGYQVGDLVRLNEIGPSGNTLNYVDIQILYITDYQQVRGYVVFSFKLLWVYIRGMKVLLSNEELVMARSEGME